jgi:hypothetical protein
MKSRSDKKVKTFQRERPTRQRREEESDAALKSAAAHIDFIAPLCNAACLIKGLRCTHGFCHPVDKVQQSHRAWPRIRAESRKCGKWKTGASVTHHMKW